MRSFFDRNQWRVVSWRRSVVLIALVLLGPTHLAFANGTLSLSKNADFLTEDRRFTQQDVLHVRVVDSSLDFNDIKDNEFRLKPDSGGDDVEGSLTNHLDGTYTARIPLSSLSGSETQWEVRVKIKDDSGNEFEDRVRIAIEADRDDDDDDDDEVEIRGRIKAIAADHIVIMRFAFFVNDETAILDNDNNPIRFADLQVGQLVEVRADRQADGSLLATKIKLEDLPDDEVELTGAIEALGDNSLVVLGRNFAVNQNTVILDNDNIPIQFADLKVGLIVEVRADRQADGALLATRIKLEDLPDDEVEVTGAISSLGDNSLVVLGLTFVVDANTVILDNNNDPIKFADLKTGLIVEIRADRRADGTLLATKIKIEDRLRLQGKIATVAGNSLSVAGIGITFDANTQFRDVNNLPLASQALRAGDLVEVQAAQPNADALVALTVKKVNSLTTSAPGELTSSLPENFGLQQNYPNPFNPSTTLRFQVPANVAAPQVVTLRIYNAIGQLVRTLADGSLAPGSYIAVWNGENDRGVQVSTGVYFYELKAGNFTVVKRMVMAK